MTSRDLGSIFKAYDVRGIYPSQIDEDAARRIGWAFARFVARFVEDRGRILVGRDMRTSSPSLARAFIEGASGAGEAVLDLGELSTDALYFASGQEEAPGAMFTASHNPARYNGLKLCKERAAPVGADSGLEAIRELAETSEAGGAGGAAPATEADPGAGEEMLRRYAAHCRSFIDPAALRPLKVAVDAGNGMAGKTVPLVFEPLPFEVVPLFFELDGTFPNHPANPIEPANLADLAEAVTEEGCDLGIAFDGDADRMFLIDETGSPVAGSTTTAMVAESLLKKNPGETVLYNLICSWSVPEVIKENGGIPLRTRVGHSFIKEIMAETGAIFGGEHSGHYYFRDNFRADSGMIAALIVLEALSLDGGSLSRMLEGYERYHASGEINSEVEDQAAALGRLRKSYADGSQDHSDGLTVEYQDWWFNCRASNTEPLLRLNLEARTKDLMEEKTNEVLTLIRGGD